MQSATGLKSSAESVGDAGTQAGPACRPPPMDFETASELLADDRRRAVVAILHDDGPISRHRLVRRIVEVQVDTTSPAPATWYRTHVALHHDHLPRLADAGLVEYDRETVAATPELERFVEWVGPLDGEKIEDSEPAEGSKTNGHDDLRKQLMAFYA